MDLGRCTQLFIILLMVTVISTKRKQGNDKQRHRGKSRKNGDVTQKSLETLRETKFANQRKVYVNDVISYACLPENTDRLVYRFQNKTHVFIGFDSLESGRLTEMVWKLKESNNDFLEGRTVSTFNHARTQDVRNKLKYNVILSASNLNHEVRFKEDMDVCESNHTGITSIYCLIQVFASLAKQMKNVTFDESCLRHGQ